MLKNNMIIFTDSNDYLYNYFKDSFDCTLVNSKEELFIYLNKNSYQFIIFSDSFILKGNVYGHKDLIDHNIFFDLPIIAYSKTANPKISQKLYSINVKFHITDDMEKSLVIDRINNLLLTTNPYIGTIRDRLVKTLVVYEGIRNSLPRMLNIVTYLGNIHKLTQYQIADIRDSLIILSIGIAQQKVLKVLQLVRNLDISKSLEDILENYKNPKEITHNIVLAIVVLFKLDKSNYFKFDLKNVQEDIVNEVVDAMAKNRFFISSSHDIYSFWEVVSYEFKNCRYLSLDFESKYMQHIFTLLYKSLINSCGVLVEFDDTDKDYFYIYVFAKRSSCGKCKKCISEEFEGFDEICLETVVRDGSDAMLLKLKKVPIIEEKVISVSKPAKNVSVQVKPSNKKIDKSQIDKMHYKDVEKISALDFLVDFEVDGYLIDELLENESDAKNILYVSEDLTHEMIEKVVVVLQRYTHLLYETIEFIDLAYSVGALGEVLNNIELSSKTEEEKSTIKSYISGIIDDLINWKEHIFIIKDTPDIHYLDASLLDNCSEIEELINKTKEENESVDSNEDDLEFF